MTEKKTNKDRFKKASYNAISEKKQINKTKTDEKTRITRIKKNSPKSGKASGHFSCSHLDRDKEANAHNLFPLRKQDAITL